MRKKLKRIAFILATEGGKTSAEKFLAMSADLTSEQRVAMAVEIASNLNDHSELIFRKALLAEVQS
ncbi:MAG: hypothetical protein WCH99_10240 [Verrucomicrobiota bacterium]